MAQRAALQVRVGLRHRTHLAHLLLHRLHRLRDVAYLDEAVHRAHDLRTLHHVPHDLLLRCGRHTHSPEWHAAVRQRVRSRGRGAARPAGRTHLVLHLHDDGVHLRLGRVQPRHCLARAHDLLREQLGGGRVAPLGGLLDRLLHLRLLVFYFWRWQGRGQPGGGPSRLQPGAQLTLDLPVEFPFLTTHLLLPLLDLLLRVGRLTPAPRVHAR